ncbi:MAG: hypothetical protein AAFR65_09905 [Pseudomonadota bacterium]
MAMLVVAGLLVLMSLFHSIIGERFILGPLKRTENLPKLWDSEHLFFVTIQATWHLVSGLWIAIAATLVAYYLYPEKAAQAFLAVFAVHFVGLAVVPFLTGSTKHKTWIVFLAMAGLLGWSAYTWG